MDRLSQSVASRFGGGSIATEAARQAAQQRLSRQLAPAHGDLFASSEPTESGLALTGQLDMLDLDANLAAQGSGSQILHVDAAYEAAPEQGEHLEGVADDMQQSVRGARLALRESVATPTRTHASGQMPHYLTESYSPASPRDSQRVEYVPRSGPAPQPVATRGSSVARAVYLGSAGAVVPPPPPLSAEEERRRVRGSARPAGVRASSAGQRDGYGYPARPRPDGPFSNAPRRVGLAQVPGGVRQSAPVSRASSSRQAQPPTTRTSAPRPVVQPAGAPARLAAAGEPAAGAAAGSGRAARQRASAPAPLAGGGTAAGNAVSSDGRSVSPPTGPTTTTTSRSRTPPGNTTSASDTDDAWRSMPGYSSASDRERGVTHLAFRPHSSPTRGGSGLGSPGRTGHVSISSVAMRSARSPARGDIIPETRAVGGSLRPHSAAAAGSLRQRIGGGPVTAAAGAAGELPPASPRQSGIIMRPPSSLARPVEQPTMIQRPASAAAALRRQSTVPRAPNLSAFASSGGDVAVPTAARRPRRTGGRVSPAWRPAGDPNTTPPRREPSRRSRSPAARLPSAGAHMRPQADDEADAHAVAALMNPGYGDASGSASDDPTQRAEAPQAGPADGSPSASGAVPTQSAAAAAAAAYSPLQPSELSEEYYERYRVRQHRNDMPDYKYSQPRAAGVLAPLAQAVFSFDEAHPGIAEQHYLRTKEQNDALDDERRKIVKDRERAARRAAAQSARAAVSESGGSPNAVASEASYMSRLRRAGQGHLDELQKENEALRERSLSVHQRALSAIAASEQITAQYGASPGRRSPSPAAHRAYVAGLSPSRTSISPTRNTPYFGPPRLYDRLPSPSAQQYVRGLEARAELVRQSAAHLSALAADPAAYSGGSQQGMAAQQYDDGQVAEQYNSGGERYDDDPDQQLLDVIDEGDRLQQQYAAQQSPQHDQHPQGQQQYSPQQQQQQYSPQQPQQQQQYDPQQQQQQHASRQVQDDAQQRREMVHAQAQAQTEAAAMRDAAEQTGDVRDSLADYMSAATRSVPLRQDELEMAAGQYSDQRYLEHMRQLEEQMQQRQLAGGYESDQERDVAAEHAAELEARSRLPPHLPDAVGDALLREQDVYAVMADTWDKQNEWMDEYRANLGPHEGYGEGEYDEEQAQRPRSAGQLQGRSPNRRPVLSERDEQLLDQNYVLAPSAELGHHAPRPAGAYRGPGSGYASDGSGDYRRVLVGQFADGTPRFFKSTVPKPFTFEERERRRPRKIWKVKADQDRALQQGEMDAIHQARFRANKIPDATLEPRYERLVLQQEMQRQHNRDVRLAELVHEIDRPFSFHHRDRAIAMEKEEARRAARDPNRFQVPFRARDVPAQTKQERLKLMMMDLEKFRAGTRERAEAARQRAKERAEAEARHRQELADRAYQERLRAVDPVWNQKFQPRPAGALPDFHYLHHQFENQMATTRALTRKRVTVPREFRLNGDSPAEQAARDAAALERRQRIILDMQLDEELLPENRWPFRSPRGRVRPTPPPTHLPPDTQVFNTRTNLLRTQATRVARRKGQYDLRDDKEARQLQRARREAEKRAQFWIDVQREAMRARGVDIDTDLQDNGDGSQYGDSAPPPPLQGALAKSRAELAGREDTPMMHIEARHKQVEQKVHDMVEDALLDAGGLAAYRYVEGTDDIKD